MAEPTPAIRLDKWLWHARALKTRSLAARFVAEGAVRVNGERVAKPATPVRPGDVLTFALGPRIRVLKILAPGTRRGPAPEAAALYEDLSPPPVPKETGPAPRDPGAGRPTKRERRALDGLRRDAS